jgi:hypothetical protein
MAESISSVSESFLHKFDPHNKEHRKAMGIGGDLNAQLFSLALSTVKSDDRSIPNLGKLAAEILKFPAQYMTALRRMGFFERGKKLGQWFIARDAVKRMKAFVKDEDSSGSKPERKKRRKLGRPAKKKAGRPRKKTGKKSAKKMRKVKRRKVVKSGKVGRPRKEDLDRFENMTLGELYAHWSEIQEEKKLLNEQEKNFRRSMGRFQKKFKSF